MTTQSTEDQKFVDTDINLTIVGSGITAVYILALLYLIRDKICCLSSLELNSLGDFLAGVFGPVAFLWLVIGYMQQRHEIKLNTAALNMQAHELRNQVIEFQNSVAQQRELVKANNKLAEQAEIKFSLEYCPVLVVEDHGFIQHKSDPLAYHNLRIVNHGYLARQLVIVFYGNAYSMTVDKPFIEQGGTWDLSYRCTDDSYPVNFEILFVDGLNNLWKSEFQATSFQAGDSKKYPVNLVKSSKMTSTEPVTS